VTNGELADLQNKKGAGSQTVGIGKNAKTAQRAGRRKGSEGSLRLTFR
jgi:hypothetical protein